MNKNRHPRYISSETLLDYLKGNISDEKRKDLELIFEAYPEYYDALEGLEEMYLDHEDQTLEYLECITQQLDIEDMIEEEEIVKKQKLLINLSNNTIKSFNDFTIKNSIIKELETISDKLHETLEIAEDIQKTADRFGNIRTLIKRLDKIYEITNGISSRNELIESRLKTIEEKVELFHSEQSNKNNLNDNDIDTVSFIESELNSCDNLILYFNGHGNNDFLINHTTSGWSTAIEPAHPYSGVGFPAQGSRLRMYTNYPNNLIYQNELFGHNSNSISKKLEHNLWLSLGSFIEPYKKYINTLVSQSANTRYINEQFSIEKTLFDLIKNEFSTNQYSALLLHLNGYEYEEIGEKLKINPEMAESLIDSVKQHLKKFIPDASLKSELSS